MMNPNRRRDRVLSTRILFTTVGATRFATAAIVLNYESKFSVVVAEGGRRSDRQIVVAQGKLSCE
jgi:hypothetical protein